MPKVPIYTRTETDRPLYQSGFSVRASADDMGAAIGRGLEDFGKGVRSFAADLPPPAEPDEMADSDDVARAKEADNALAAYTREALYGETGFLGLSGRAAVDAEKGVVAGIAARRQELAASLPPGAQRYFNAAAGTRLNQAFDLTGRHTAENRLRWHGEASSGRVENFGEEAVVNANDPAKVQMNLALGEAEILQAGEEQGLDTATLEATRQSFISSTQKKITLRLAEGDPIAAASYFENHRHQLTGEDQLELGELLDGAINDATTRQMSDEIMTNIRNGDGDIETALASIPDQGMAETVRRRVSAALSEQEQADGAQGRAAKQQFVTALEGGASPDNVPLALRQQVGMEAIAKGWDYVARRASGQQIESPPDLVYQLRRAAAQDPAGFARYDLNDHFNQLSKSERTALASLQQVASTDIEKARKDGRFMADVYKKTEMALAEIGISQKHRYGPDREATKQQIAEIANAMPGAVDTFRKDNNGRDPDAFEVGKLINQQLLPLVMRGRPTRVG